MRRMWIGLGLLPVVWALTPALESVFRSRTDILIDQLAGRGCQYQERHSGTHSLNPLARFTVRHPEFACPLWAAEDLAAERHSPADRARILAAIESALQRQPAVFDTGDGVIQYASELTSARAAILGAP